MSEQEKKPEPAAETPDADKAAKNEAKKAAKAAKKAAKAAAKAKAAAEREAQAAAQRAAELESMKDVCGTLPLPRSLATDKTDRTFADIKNLTKDDIGKEFLFRARVHSCRAAGGNLAFVMLRQRVHTMQAVVCKSETVPKPMVKFITGIPDESIVDVTGTLVAPEAGQVESATLKYAELSVKTLFVVSRAEPKLPFQLADAMTPRDVVNKFRENVKVINDKLEALGDGEDKKEEREKLEAELAQLKAEVRPVGQALRLDNRCVDLRTPANQAIFRVQSGVCQLFRAYLYKNGFMEVHSPKMIGAKSEGGANVFELGYFDRKAYLAQSPQFYKQMCMCADFDRVFEVAPVFRAENSNTPRHMTEFIGLDMEMTFKEHYHEVLDMLDGMFEAIFTGLKNEFAEELKTISQQYPIEPFEAKFPSPLVPFAEGVKMLNDAGIKQDPFEDLSTENERVLGRLVKEKYGTDFYRLDKFPTAARPFYTMLDPVDEKITNSYDFMMRGQEILSGAQRIHDMEMLIERAKHHEVDLPTVEGYTSAFKYGAPPHAGGGIGLNRVTMLYLGLDRITQSTLFPRLPGRLYP